MEEYIYLKELGFSDFAHLKKEDRDGRTRMVWMQIVDNEIVAFRIVLCDHKWIIDYVSPQPYAGLFANFEELLDYIRAFINLSGK